MSPFESSATPCGARNFPVSRPGPFSPPSRAMRLPLASTMLRRGPRFGAFRLTGMPVNLKAPNLGPRLSIVDARGKRIARLGGENGPGLETGKFLAPHGVALDSKGDIYVGEVGVTNWKTSFPNTPMPAVVRCLQKLEKVGAW